MRALYYVVMTVIGYALVHLGWDSIDGVPMLQFALVLGGAVFGHLITEGLNYVEGEDA